MTRPGQVLALGVTMMILSGTIALQLGVPWPAGPAVQGAADARPQRSPAAMATADLAALRADRMRGWAEAALARPLFSPSRRPPATSDGDGGAEELPRLAGVLVGPDGGAAIFAPPRGKPFALREGGILAGFRVRRIAAGEVTLSGPQGETVLRPSPAPAGTATPARPAAPPAGFPRTATTASSQGTGALPAGAR